MRVLIQRDKAVRPGHETWLQVLDDLVFTVSEAGTTRFGVACLQACWDACIAAGHWEWSPGKGNGARTVYVPTTRLPEGEPVRVQSSPGLVRVELCAWHFAPATTLALGAAAQSCIDAGWVVHAHARPKVSGA